MKIKMRYTECTTIEVGKLKGCPFCGKIDKLDITSNETFDKLVAQDGSACVSIECERCDACITEYEYNGNNYGVIVGLVVGKWNGRVENGD